MNYYTYRIANSITGRSYFGSSSNLKRRWYEHKRASRIKNHPLYLDIRTLGLESFYIEKIGVFDSRAKARIMEDKLIMDNPSSYNVNRVQFNKLYRDWETDRKSTRLNSSHLKLSRMPSSA